MVHIRKSLAAIAPVVLLAAGWMLLCEPVSSVMAADSLAAEKAALASLTGKIEATFDGGGNVISIKGSSRLTDADLIHFLAFTHVETVELFADPQELRITGSGLAHLKFLPKLAHLGLSCQTIDDEGLRRVAELSQVTTLVLKSLGDDRLPLLAGMTGIKHIRFEFGYGPKLTNAGMKHLAKFANLETVELMMNAVADISELRALPKLKKLALSASFADDGLIVLDQMKSVTDLTITSDFPLSGRRSLGRTGAERIGRMRQLERLALVGVSLEDKDLDALAGLVELRELDLSGNLITGIGLQHLRRMTKLRRLKIGHLPWVHTPLVADEFIHLPALPELETLILWGGKESPKASNLSQMKKLRHFEFTPLTDDVLAQLEGLERLEVLGWSEYGGGPVSDAGLRSVATLSELKELRLYDVEASEKGLEHLGTLVKLERLSLPHLGVPEVGVEWLTALTELRELDIYNSLLNDSHLKGLENAVELRLLELKQCNVTDIGLEYMATLVRLEKLDLSSTKVKGAGLRHLAGMKHLQTLDLWDNGLAADGCANLPPLPSIEALHVRCVEADDAVAPKIAAMPKLKELTFFPLNDKVLKELESARGLESLRPSYRYQLIGRTLGCPNVTDEGLKSIGKLHSLKHLMLRESKISDAGLANLTDLRELAEVDLSETGVTDRGLAHLRKATELRILNLDETRVGDEGLAHLSDLTKLHALGLEKTPITDAGLEQLEKVTGLQTLDVRHTEVTAAGIARFEKVRRHCYVSHTTYRKK